MCFEKFKIVRFLAKTGRNLFRQKLSQHAAQQKGFSSISAKALASPS